MVEELLAFASIGGSLERRQLSLAKLVEAVTVDLNLGLRQAGAVIECDDFVFEADEEQMRTALQNLIQNAVAYARSGVRPVIRVQGQRTGAGVVVRVADNCKGIAAEDRGRVAGSGLGLATCARIAAAHGGRLEIAGNQDEGTSVSLFLGDQMDAMGHPGSG